MPTSYTWPLRGAAIGRSSNHGRTNRRIRPPYQPVSVDDPHIPASSRPCCTELSNRNSRPKHAPRSLDRASPITDTRRHHIKKPTNRANSTPTPPGSNPVTSPLDRIRLRPEINLCEAQNVSRRNNGETGSLCLASAVTACVACPIYDPAANNPPNS